MDESKQAWAKVGEQFSAVGARLKEHVKQPGSATASDAEQDHAAVVEALNKLGRALDDAVDRVGGAVKDPGVRDHLRQALNAMGEAVNTTLGEVGDRAGERVRRAFGGKRPS